MPKFFYNVCFFYNVKKKWDKKKERQLIAGCQPAINIIIGGHYMV